MRDVVRCSPVWLVMKSCKAAGYGVVNQARNQDIDPLCDPVRGRECRGRDEDKPDVGARDSVRSVAICRRFGWLVRLGTNTSN